MTMSAKKLLLMHLKDHKPHDVKRIMKDAKYWGISKRDMKIMKGLLHITTTNNADKEKGAEATKWFWTLPEEVDVDAGKPH